MDKLKNINTALILDEMSKRDSRVKSKLYDASCALEKVKLIAFNFSQKYNLDSANLDRGGEVCFLRDRQNMNTEISILSDYILQIDKLINSIEDEDLYCDASKEVTA